MEQNEEERIKMRRKIHLCLNIEGALKAAKAYVGEITVDGKVLNTVNEVEAFFKEHLAMGRRVLPLGDCDNFDYQTGCKGHVIDEEEK